jgi:hypothetical protein
VSDGVEAGDSKQRWAGGGIRIMQCVNKLKRTETSQEVNLVLLGANKSFDFGVAVTEESGGENAC